ncbi:hypothetical protein, partial [Luedemannella flava]|uniref:hypothetical protein n=1 Tax=Luedemannella flava TaxID=349316 RepID=UPI0031D74E77
TARGSATPSSTRPTTRPAATGAPSTRSAATVKGCAAKPSACGFPDGTSTGVRAGVSLRRVPQDVTSGPGWAWDTRGWIAVKTDGAVVSGISTTATIDIQASNVVVKNVRVHQRDGMFGIAIRHGRNVTVQDSEIYGDPGEHRLMVGIKDIYADSVGTRLVRNDIWAVATGIQIDAGPTAW